MQTSKGTCVFLPLDLLISLAASHARFFLSPKEPNLWVLIGHWCAAEQMTIHFSNELMEAMLRSLVGYPVDIEFSHFLMKPTETSAETRNPGNILVGMNVTADTEQAPC